MGTSEFTQFFTCTDYFPVDGDGRIQYPLYQTVPPKPVSLTWQKEQETSGLFSSAAVSLLVIWLATAAGYVLVEYVVISFAL
jgi:hypothetical protein